MPIYAGTQKIDVSGIEKVYVGTQLVYQKNIPQVLDSITLSGQTTSLYRDSAFSFGGTVTANYTNGTTADVTSLTTFSGYDMSTAGTYTVTASYTEDGITKTATYQLTVNKAWTIIWSGTKKLTWGTGESLPSPSAADIIDPQLSGSQRFRITFTMLFGGSKPSGTTDKYYLTGSEKTTKPSSPQSITINADSNSLKIVGLINGASDGGKYIALNYKPSSSLDRKGFYLSAYYYKDHSGGYKTRTLTMTVTKIEIYY